MIMTMMVMFMKLVMLIMTMTMMMIVMILVMILPGMVVREEADWAMSDITFSPEREEYVDFSKAFVYDASELVTPRAKPLPRWTSPTR